MHLSPDRPVGELPRVVAPPAGHPTSAGTRASMMITSADLDDPARHIDLSNHMLPDRGRALAHVLEPRIPTPHDALVVEGTVVHATG